jgi:hypothetical protein
VEEQRRSERGSARRKFYRIVQTDPPALVDFLSDLERGRGRPDLPPALHRLL